MRPPRGNGYRDTWCGEIGAGRVGETVRVAGWVHRRRDHGGLIFIDLRDRTGLVQLVFHPESAAEAHAAAERLRPEHVISATGEVVRREEGNVNPNLATGEIELDVVGRRHARRVRRRRRSRSTRTVPVDEMLRLRHRMLDLRREGMRDSMVLRHTVTRAMRDYLDAHDFLDIETPILTRSTPEGARDFLVPSRMNPGEFYALPQSPQLFKQLLMVSGYERYFQIARCFRDEDLRADRQPEFTQLDLEMSFVEEDDVIEVIEGLMARVFEDAGFPVSAAAAVAAAQLRRGDAALRLRQARRALRPRAARPRRRARAAPSSRSSAACSESGGVIRGLNAGAREVPRSELDALTEHVRRFGAGGLVWAFVQEDGTWRSPTAKFLTDEQREAVDAQARRPARRPAAVRRRLPSSSPRPRSASCGSSSRAASTSFPRAATTSSGSSSSRCSSGARPTAAGPRCTIRSPRRPATSPTRAR